jgi:hypothetical protein
MSAGPSLLTFVKALHPTSIEALVAVDEFWPDQVYPFLRSKAREESPNQPLPAKVYEDSARTARHRLLTLASGHLDPDVRNAAEQLLMVLERVVIMHIFDEPGEHHLVIPWSRANPDAGVDYIKDTSAEPMRTRFRSCHVLVGLAG